MKCSYWALGLGLVASRAFGAEGVSSATVETEVSTGVFYFSDDPKKMAASETERGEDGLEFHADRDPREVARDSAEEEIRQGNVCLRQTKSDLHAAVKKFRVRGLCEEIYSEELAAALEKASRTKLHADVFRCYAEAEAHEKEGFVTLSLTFRGQLATHSPVPRKFQRAGFPDEPIDWALPNHTLTAGAQWGWKGALKRGACSYDGAALDRLAGRVRDEKREAVDWAKCSDEESTTRDRLVRVQDQFRAYVPDDWVAKEDVGDLLQPPFGTTAKSAAECREALTQVKDHLADLQKLSGRLADEHGITALRESGRVPASVATEVED